MLTFNFSISAEKEMLTGLSPTENDGEADEVEKMMRGSQGRKSSAAPTQVMWKEYFQRQLKLSTFQMTPPTVDVDDDKEAEERKRSAPSIQVNFKSETAKGRRLSYSHQLLRRCHLSRKRMRKRVSW